MRKWSNFKHARLSKHLQGPRRFVCSFLTVQRLSSNRVNRSDGRPTAVWQPSDGRPKKKFAKQFSAEQFSAENSPVKETNPKTHLPNKFFAEKFGPRNSGNSFSGLIKNCLKKGDKAKHVCHREQAFFWPWKIFDTAKKIFFVREKYLIPRKRFSLAAKNILYRSKQNSLKVLLVKCTSRRR